MLLKYNWRELLAATSLECQEDMSQELNNPPPIHSHVPFPQKSLIFIGHTTRTHKGQFSIEEQHSNSGNIPAVRIVTPVSAQSHFHFKKTKLPRGRPAIDFPFVHINAIKSNIFDCLAQWTRTVDHIYHFGLYCTMTPTKCWIFCRISGRCDLWPAKWFSLSSNHFTKGKAQTSIFKKHFWCQTRVFQSCTAHLEWVIFIFSRFQWLLQPMEIAYRNDHLLFFPQYVDLIGQLLCHLQCWMMKHSAAMQLLDVHILRSWVGR